MLAGHAQLCTPACTVFVIQHLSVHKGASRCRYFHFYFAQFAPLSLALTLRCFCLQCALLAWVRGVIKHSPECTNVHIVTFSAFFGRQALAFTPCACRHNGDADRGAGGGGEGVLLHPLISPGSSQPWHLLGNSALAPSKKWVRVECGCSLR